MKYLLVQACGPESNPQNAWKEGGERGWAGRQLGRGGEGEQKDKRRQEGKRQASPCGSRERQILSLRSKSA